MFCAGFSNNSVGMWHWCWHLGGLIWLCKISQRCLHSEQKNRTHADVKTYRHLEGTYWTGKRENSCGTRTMCHSNRKLRQVCGVIIEYSKYIHTGLLRMVDGGWCVHCPPEKKPPKTVSFNFLCGAGTLKLTLVSFCCHIVHMWNMTWNQYVCM